MTNDDIWWHLLTGTLYSGGNIENRFYFWLCDGGNAPMWQQGGVVLSVWCFLVFIPYWNSVSLCWKKDGRRKWQDRMLIWLSHRARRCQWCKGMTVSPVVPIWQSSVIWMTWQGTAAMPGYCSPVPVSCPVNILPWWKEKIIIWWNRLLTRHLKAYEQTVCFYCP